MANPVISDQLRGELDLYETSSLELDPENPRLPEELTKRPQPELLRYLYDTQALEEIAQSLVDNGFFTHEPLIILETKAKSSKYIVLEGNRRLAAIMILRDLKVAEGLTFDIEVNSSVRQRLEKVPCFKVSDRQEVYRYLGFRHIGGIKTWGAEAKARYIAREVARAVTSGSDQPFRDVARRVGSNSQGIRNNYIALTIMRHARDEFGINTKTLQNERFTVWLRALNSGNIRAYIGFGDASGFREIETALTGIKKKRIQRVFEDLSPDKGVVEDSRDITDYGRILANSRAVAVLEKHRDFELARQIVEEQDLPLRILRIVKQCQILQQDIVRAEPSSELLEATLGLRQVAIAIHATAKDLGSDEEK